VVVPLASSVSANFGNSVIGVANPNPAENDARYNARNCSLPGGRLLTTRLARSQTRSSSGVKLTVEID
jgi:hypothetical protein